MEKDFSNERTHNFMIKEVFIQTIVHLWSICFVPGIDQNSEKGAVVIDKTLPLQGGAYFSIYVIDKTILLKGGAYFLII